MKKKFLYPLLLFVLLAGLTAGVVLDRLVLTVPGSATDVLTDEAWEPLLEEAVQTIEDHYVDQTAVTDENLTYGAIEGMVDSLGDTGHSRFLSPEMVREQEIYTAGEFEGIGAYVEMRDGYPTIVAPIDNSPAQAAGLQPGDIIMAVNDIDITGMPLNDVVTQILGPVGTQVKLTILTPETGETRELTLTRARIDLHNVTWVQLPGTTIAHIRISGFSKDVSQDLQQALTEAQNQGVTGVILDLRNNPGGLLNEAIGVANQFLPRGTAILQRKDAQGHVKTETAVGGGAGLEIPLVVLINQGSASASEIVAGALQDNQRALLLGETTFGTGTVLNEFDLSDGSALLLATEEWLTPSGRVIWRKGVLPEKVVDVAAGTNLLIPESERELSAEELQASEDIQLLQAVQLLTGQSRP